MNSSRYYIPFLEYMVSDACNLACDGCTNYSNYRVKGITKWQQARQEISSWIERGLEIGCMSLIGGEPLINPDIVKYINGIVEMLPGTRIHFVTNGTFVDRIPPVLEALDNCFSFTFHVSVHGQEFDKTEQIKSMILSMKSKSWKENSDRPEHLRTSWINQRPDFNRDFFEVSSPDSFVKTYRGPVDQMLPYDNDPSASFDVCTQQTCPLLYRGRLYKCSTSGVLKRVLKDFNRLDHPEWQPYVQYDGIGPECSNKDLREFIDNYGKPLDICRMCPSSKDFPSVKHISIKKAKVPIYHA